MWTRFMDMHSGGGSKEDWAYIYIESSEEKAKTIFYNRFGHNPERVTCTCCGEDYSISEEEDLEQATAHERNCEFVYLRPDGSECEQKEAWLSGSGMNKGYSSGYAERQKDSTMRIREQCNTDPDKDWGLYITLDNYIKSGNVKVIKADEIKLEEKQGPVPEEGYVWM